MFLSDKLLRQNKKLLLQTFLTKLETVTKKSETIRLWYSKVCIDIFTYQTDTEAPLYIY